MNEQESIKELGSVREKNPNGSIHCLTIIGQIEGHQALPDDAKTTKYEHVMPLLAAVEESPEIDGLLILLNTMGGDVEAGLGIAELISGMTKPTASLVLGGGHSIGVPMAVAAQRSFIAPSAAVTIHPVRLTGVVIGAPQTYSYFEKMQERIVRFITDHSHVTRVEPGPSIRRAWFSFTPHSLPWHSETLNSVRHACFTRKQGIDIREIYFYNKKWRIVG